MTYGLYVSAAGADAQSRRMEVLSNNLANVDTVGFKREFAILQARHSEAIERGDDYAGSRSMNDIGGGVRVQATATDFSLGVLKQTGIDTDMAINGEGFFLIEKDDQQLLTRAGNFQFAPDGRLITQDGYSVLDDSGNAIRLNGPEFRMLPGGVIQQGGDTIPLAVVKPNSQGDLVKVGETAFSPLAPPTRIPPGERQVVNGYLEHSTVSPTAEMMQLIETSRAYETNVRMIQNHDNVLGSLVNRLLRQA
jgi:flagellar basal-body rod protein FlgF/flagellar basal-body rod protein FlgG